MKQLRMILGFLTITMGLVVLGCLNLSAGSTDPVAPAVPAAPAAPAAPAE